MDTFSNRPVMINGVLVLPTTLNPTETQLFNGLSVIEDTELVHFMPAGYFKELLESKQLHLNRVDGYEDDSGEGMYPEINLTESSNMDAQIEEGFQTTPNRREKYSQALITRKMTYVHCWFKGEPDSEHMWKKYGDNGNGICIQGSSNRLKLNISFDRSKFNGNVSSCVYLDPDEPIPVGVSWFPSIRKDKQRFDMEQEIRFLIRYEINKLPREIDLDDLPEFQKLPVDLDGLIKLIYFGPKMRESQKEAIFEIIKKSGLADRIRTFH